MSFEIQLVGEMGVEAWSRYVIGRVQLSFHLRVVD